MSLRRLRLVFCFLAFLAFTSFAHAASDVAISQVYGGGGNSGATLRNDFIELVNRGTSPVSLSGWSVQYASATGTTWQRTNLPAVTLQPGQYYLIQEAQGAGGTVSLPTPDVTGTIPMSATSGKVALVNNQLNLAGACPTANIVDFVGFGSSANCFEGTGPTPTLSNTIAALRAGNGCTDTDNNSADFTTGAPNPRNSATFATCGVAPPPVPVLAINEIQGSGSTSPYDGQLVETSGIVTARLSNGFFLQNPTPDADSNTSEGIFVFTSSAPPSAAAVGSSVTVRGTVDEFSPASAPLNRPITELTSPVVTLLTPGNPLPTPAAITAADLTTSGGLEQLEKYEGMRVSVASLTVVAPTDGFKSEANATSNSDGVFYAVLTGTPRPFREPGISLLEAVPAGAPAGVPRWDTNPERLRIDSDRQSGAETQDIDATSGAVLEDMVGVLHYDFGTYSIFPDPGQTFTFTNATAQPIPAAGASELTVASFNMERFYDNVNDAGGDAVLNDAGYARRLNKASLTIRNILGMPDILGLVEIENLATLQALSAKIDADAVAAGQPAPGYAAYLEEGNDPGLIDVGYLVKPSRVSVVSVTQVGKGAVFIDPTDSSVDILNDRPPLVLVADVTNEGVTQQLTVIVNHLRSLNDIDDPASGPRVRAKRAAQAEYLANLIQDQQEGGGRVISLGDYNAFEFSDGYVDVMGAILGSPAPADEVVLANAALVDPLLTNLMSMLPADDRYSYVFEGSAQVLDHILVNSTLLPQVNSITVARVNADFPEIFRSDDTRPERLSDHDAPVAYIELPHDTFDPEVSVTGVTDGATYLLGTVPTAGCTASDAHSGIVDATPDPVTTGGNTNGTGSFTVTCTAEDNVGNTAQASATYTVQYAFSGFLPPLHDGGTAKARSTIPVKFALADGNGTTLTDVSMIASITYAPCGGSSSTPAASTGGTSLRYDATAGHFIFNWSTKGLAPGCYQLTLTLDSGQQLSASITLK